jgi:dTDP-4-dehydrorhamnose reductase
MSSRILLTGSTGQLGSELAARLPVLGRVLAPKHAELDLTKPDQIRRVVSEFRPSLIINAAAYTAVDRAETDVAAARAMNAEAPAVLAEEARKIGATLVHYSTDYVFDGTKNSAYTEEDQPNPLNVYGSTKLEGELAIRASGVSHLIFRTAWVYSTAGKNFLLTILRLATEREELRVVCDQFGAPTWAREIGYAVLSVLEKVRRGDALWSNVSGTYHMTAGGVTSWHGFAQAILDEAARAPSRAAWLAHATSGRPLIARRVVPITTADYPTPARRPPYSVLSNSLLTSTFGVALPSWPAQLQSTVAQDRGLASPISIPERS